jgi:hypothetical protein
VQWQLDVSDGKYVKRTDPNGKPLPENNWVWSPQGAIAMHMPERWGYVQFSAVVPPTTPEAFVQNPDEPIKWALRRLYYRQADHRQANGRYARTMAALGASDLSPNGLQLHATDDLYVMTAPSPSGAIIMLRQDGRVWARETRKN